MDSPAAIALLYTLLCLIWGSTWLAIKVGLVGVPPFLGAGLRFALAAAVLFAIVAWRRLPLKMDRDGRKAVLSCGFLSFTACYAGVYWAEQYVSSGVSAVLYCTMPLATALLSRFWTRAESLTAMKVAGIALGMAGTVALFWTGEAVAGRQFWGMAVCLASAIGASVNLVTVKKHGRGMNVFVMNACGMAIGAACLLLMSVAVESYAALRWTPSNALAIVYLSLAGTVVTFVTYYHLLRLMDATRLSLISLIFPIIALLLGAAFGGERITGGSVASIAAVLAGVAVASAPRRRRSPVPIRV